MKFKKVTPEVRGYRRKRIHTSNYFQICLNRNLNRRISMYIKQLSTYGGSHFRCRQRVRSNKGHSAYKLVLLPLGTLTPQIAIQDSVLGPRLFIQYIGRITWLRKKTDTASMLRQTSACPTCKLLELTQQEGNKSEIFI